MYYRFCFAVFGILKRDHQYFKFIAKTWLSENLQCSNLIQSMEPFFLILLHPDTVRYNLQI